MTTRHITFIKLLKVLFVTDVLILLVSLNYIAIKYGNTLTQVQIGIIIPILLGAAFGKGLLSEVFRELEYNLRRS